MNITKLNVSLEGYDIGISGAVPEPSAWSEPAMDRGILEFVSLFSGLVFKYGGRIVHGTHPALTPIILRQARLQAGDRSRKPVTLVISDLWAKDYSMDSIEAMIDVAELIITDKRGEGTADDPATRNQSLTVMRRKLVDAQNVMVLVGGKLHESDGIKAGVLEEMEMAQKKQLPCFLVAGLGGLAAKLAQDVMPASLHNALTSAENLTLFTTQDVAASVSVIFNQLALSEVLRRSLPE